MQQVAGAALETRRQALEFAADGVHHLPRRSCSRRRHNQRLLGGRMIAPAAAHTSMPMTMAM
jgi:hypothetical protein